MHRKTLTLPVVRRALAAAALSVAALATHAVAQTGSDPFRALPASDLVVVVDVRRALTEAAPRVLASDQKTLTQMNVGIDGLKTLTGIDARAVRRIVVGMRELSPQQMSADKLKGVAVIEGIDTAKVFAFLRTAKAGQFTEQDYQGTAVYTVLTDNQKPINPNVELAALDAQTLIVGTPAELRAGLDAGAGRGARVSPELAAAASRHSTALVAVAFVVPESLKEMIANSGNKGGTDPNKPGGASDPTSQMVASALSSLRMFSAAVGLTPAGYNGLVSARLDTAERAGSLADTLSGLKSLTLMEPPKNERDRILHGLLRAAEVSAQGEEVILKAEVAQTDIDALMKLSGVTARPAAAAKPATTTPRRRAPARRRGATRRPRT